MRAPFRVVFLAIALASVAFVVVAELLGGLWAALASGAALLLPFVIEQARHRGQREIQARAARDATSSALPSRTGDERRRNTGYADLLRPERAVVPFTGRDAELRLLREWCEKADAPPIALVTGPGGVGKTRLALHLGQQLESQGWSCRLVHRGHVSGAAGPARDTVKGPVLLIVDYAETRDDLLGLVTIAATEVGKHALRVLLLARSAGEWWEHLAEADSPVAGPVGRAPVAELGPEPARTDDELIRHAVPYFAAELGVDPPALHVEPVHGGRPLLVLHTAALLAALAGRAEPDREVCVAADLGVLDRLLTHEKRYWYDSAAIAGLTVLGGLDRTVIQRCVAVTGLLSPGDEAAADRTLALVPDLADVGAAVRRRVARWLRSLYPPDEAWIGPLRPDLLAEHHIAAAVGASPELAANIRDAFEEAAGHARRALTVLARATDHHPEAERILRGWLETDLPAITPVVTEVAMATSPSLARLFTELLDTSDLDAAQWTTIRGALPAQSRVLNPAGRVAARRTLEALPPDADPLTRYRALEVLAARQLQGGLFPEAANAAEEAERLARELDPTAAGDLLRQARSLRAAALSAGGHDREAERLARGTAPTGPDLARIRQLLSAGMISGRIGRSSEAIAALEEAVTLLRDVAEQDPTTLRPVLAVAMSTLGLALGENRRFTEAVPLLHEAEALTRDLERADPDAHTVLLADVLGNLALTLANDNGGRAGEGVAAAAEHVRLRRELTAIEPAQRAELAAALNTQAIALGRAGDPGWAAPMEEAVALGRDLAAADPAAHLLSLGIYLKDHAYLLATTGDLGRAGPTAEDAMRVLERVAADYAGRVNGYLISCAKIISSWHADMGRHDEARAVLHKVMKLRQSP